jgi:hypothetical protein
MVALGKHTEKPSDESPKGDASVGAATFKVAFAPKAIAFILTTVALSWFFEGWREVAKEVTLPHCLVLFAGVAFTALLLGVQGYWIYVEEKLKGALKKRIGLFETIFAHSSLGKRINGDSGEES